MIPLRRFTSFPMKRLFLGVTTRTPNLQTYRECGRFNLLVISSVKCIRYWVHLLIMPQDRNQRKIYFMLSLLHKTRKHGYMISLNKCGFGMVRECQGTRNKLFIYFLQILKQKLVDCHHRHAVQDDKFNKYLQQLCLKVRMWNTETFEILK